MRFLADECCDTGLVESLRNDGHDVSYVAEEKPGTPDDEILIAAYNEGRILITEDKDFGELVYRLKKPSIGIILIRIDVKDKHLKWELLKKLLDRYSDRLSGNFVVIDTKKYRFRPIVITRE